MTVGGVDAWTPIATDMTDQTGLRCQREIGDLLHEVTLPSSETEMAGLAGIVIVKVVSKVCC